MRRSIAVEVPQVAGMQTQRAHLNHARFSKAKMRAIWRFMRDTAIVLFRGREGAGSHDLFRGDNTCVRKKRNTELFTLFQRISSFLFIL